jgi:biotin transport system substrate-specific component
LAQAEATLGQAAIKKGGLTADALLILAGVVLVALVAQIRIHLPFTPVPITGQTFGVLLVGASLGAWRGLSSLLAYLLVGALGLPVYAGSQRGWEVVQGPTGGYLVGFVVAAAVVGSLAQRGWDKKLFSSILAMLVGSIIIYIFGLLWLSRVGGTDLPRTLELGLYPFLLGDALKLLMASAALPAAWRLVRRIHS